MAGTPSASAKRSAEQKMVELKLAEQKNWWGPSGHWVAGTPSASAKRSVEQKMAEQKFGGDPWPLGVRATSASAERSAEQKMAELKLAEQKNLVGTHGKKNKKWWGPSAIGWQEGPLVQVQKGQRNKKWRN